jgi:uncharacterized repeat protein (TIGR01451 family)
VKFFSNFFRALILALALHLITATAGAQTFGLSAVASAGPISDVTAIDVSNSLTYTIDVTNNSLADENITVSNTFTGALPISFIQFSSTGAGVVTNTTNTVIFPLGIVPVNTIEEMTVTLEPLALGALTDSIVVNSFVITNTTNVVVSTNVVVLILTTNQADLGVTMSGFPAIAYTNDWVTYNVSVTNAGPAAATDVILTNSFPTNGVELLSVSPTNQNFQTINSNLIFNFGKLPVGSATNLQITVMPTNAGVFAFSASVGTTNQLDMNTGNNSFTTDLTVTNFLAGTAGLTASMTSGQVFNRQTGREQMVVTLSNGGANPIASARVMVTGLTNWLFNAVGTNNGNPYVVYGAPLANGTSVNLTLQFYPNRSGFPFSNSQLQPVEIEQPDLTLPATGNTSAAINILLVTNTASGYLVEFQSISNRTYTIAYNDNLASTNWLAAQPPFRTTANYVLWIDYGPPATLSNAPSSRMYRVYMYPQTP